MRRVLQNRWLRWLGGIALAIVSWILINEWLAERDWQKYADAARSRGVKLTLSELFPNQPIPDEENFAAVALFLRDGSKVNPPPVSAKKRVRDVSDGRPSLVRLGVFADGMRETALVTGDDAMKSDAEVILLGASKSGNFLDQLRDAASLPQARYLIDWSQGYASSSEGYFDSNSVGFWVDLTVIAHLELGNDAEAISAWKVGAAIARSMNREPSLDVYSLSSNMRSRLRNCVREGLERGTWQDSSLREIERELNEWNEIALYQFAVESERVLHNTRIERFLPDRDVAGLVKLYIGGSGTDRIGLNPVDWYSYIRMKTRRYWRENQLWLNQRADEEIQSFDAVAERWVPIRTRRFDQEAVQGTLEKSDLALATFMADHSYYSPEYRAYMHANTRMAGLACALARFHRARGAYPIRLDDLVPDFIDRMPHDPCTGKSFIYRRDQNEGYFLYSVGENLIDDQAASGKRREPDSSWPDWRWWAPRAAR